MTPTELYDACAEDSELLVIDTRQSVDRTASGFIAGSVHLPRTVVEWRADPASGYTDPHFTGFGQRIVVVCNDGYSSSLAAANLRRLGYAHATDLIGGFEAWRRAACRCRATPEPSS